MNPPFILKTTNILKILLLLILLFFIPAAPGIAETENIKTIAIIPFEANSQSDISYMKSGIMNMLNSRLSWKDHVKVIDKKTIAKELQGFNSDQENKIVQLISEKTGAEYVLLGSITEFTGAFSLDVIMYDIKNQSCLTFFDQTSQTGEVIKKLDTIISKINKKIFNRTTFAYENLKREQTLDEETLKRMNPEQMLPYVQKTDNDEDENPWWKIW